MQGKRAALIIGLMLTPLTAVADMNDFGPGAVIRDFGPVAPVPSAERIPAGTEFKIAYDTRVGAEEGKPNPTLETAARFLNMHQAAGVPVENIELAVVVHGPAHRDLLKAERYGGVNPTAKLIEQLVANGVRIHLCGQTAAYYDVSAGDLLPGVRMSLSAMTSHALLQQEGFTLNPF